MSQSSSYQDQSQPSTSSGGIRPQPPSAPQLWQPPPSQWPAIQQNIQQQTSVWGSQDAEWMASNTLTPLQPVSQSSTYQSFQQQPQSTPRSQHGSQNSSQGSQSSFFTSMMSEIGTGGGGDKGGQRPYNYPGFMSPDLSLLSDPSPDKPDHMK